eukprot:EG_transcript_62638
MMGSWLHSNDTGTALKQNWLMPLSRQVGKVLLLVVKCAVCVCPEPRALTNLCIVSITLRLFLYLTAAPSHNDNGFHQGCAKTGVQWDFQFICCGKNQGI